MEIPCPVCRKTSGVPPATACPRCGCDLSQLAEILEAAAAHALLAAQQLKSGHWDHALAHAEQSWDLAHGPEAAQLACAASMALHQTGPALKWRRLWHAHRTDSAPSQAL